jgi:hypothetical protein
VQHEGANARERAIIASLCSTAVIRNAVAILVAMRHGTGVGAHKRPVSIRRSTAAISGLAAATLVMVGCGDSNKTESVPVPAVTVTGASPGTNDQGAIPPQLVTARQIKGQPKGSPSAALLEWWQAAQFGDVDTLRGLTAPATAQKFGPARLDRLIATAGPALGGLRPAGTFVRGNKAGVRAIILQFGGKGGHTTQPSGSFTTTFTLMKTGGGWKYADANYLRGLLKNYPGAR